MSRGDANFLISIVYSVLIILGIWLAVQAFTSVVGPRDESEHKLTVIEHMLEARSSAYINLGEHERIFIGFRRDDCKTTMDSSSMGLTGLCDENAFCYCYVYTPPGESPIPTCRTMRWMPPDTGFERIVPAGSSATVRGCGATTEAGLPGLYAFSYQAPTGSEPGKITIEKRAEGVEP